MVPILSSKLIILRSIKENPAYFLTIFLFWCWFRILRFKLSFGPSGKNSGTWPRKKYLRMDRIRNEDVMWYSESKFSLDFGLCKLDARLPGSKNCFVGPKLFFPEPNQIMDPAFCLNKLIIWHFCTFQQKRQLWTTGQFLLYSSFWCFRVN